MLPRGLNRVGGNRLGGRGEENKRVRKRGREEEDNQIVFDGVRILRIHRHLVDESPLFVSAQGLRDFISCILLQEDVPFVPANAHTLPPDLARRRFNVRHEKE